MTVRSAHTDSERTAGDVGKVISYGRFLERRAWREKIAADHHRLEHEWIEIQSSLTVAGAAETRLIVENRREAIMPNTNPGRELMCPVCPKRLRYVTTRHVDGYVHQKRDAFRTVADVHVYECASHGRFHMGPNGRMSSGS
jgi:hypothetical protein